MKHDVGFLEAIVMRAGELQNETDEPGMFAVEKTVIDALNGDGGRLPSIYILLIYRSRRNERLFNK